MCVKVFKKKMGWVLMEFNIICIIYIDIVKNGRYWMNVKRLCVGLGFCEWVLISG